VFFSITALGHGFAIGTTALIGAAIGGGKMEEARTYAIQGVSFAVLLGVLICALGIYFSPLAFRSLGAEGEYLDICLAYMDRIFLGGLFFHP
jgi:Na+-driven multidrug efflux pump